MPEYIKFRGAVYQQVASGNVDQYLYHSTFVHNLESIQQHGLGPGGRRTWQTYDTAGKVFLSEAGGVFTWNAKLGDMAHHESDYPVEEGWIPITLRIPRKYFKGGLQPDPEGSKDAMNPAYHTSIMVPASKIEVWTGSAWDQVENVDEYELRSYAEAAAKREHWEGEEEQVLLDDEVFFPRELKP